MARKLLNYPRKWKTWAGSIRTNLQGQLLRGRYLLIESDDWGAIRTPSNRVIREFKQYGLNLDQSLYKYDALASEGDLDALFNLLHSIRDINGRTLRLTANVVVANPDFEAIKANDYNYYEYEHFTETFKRYPQHNNNWAKWQQAIAADLFQPQFHGREHLQINRWLRALKNNLDETRFCFTQQTTYSGQGDYSFMEAYDWDLPEDIEQQRSIIRDGLKIFRETFGFSSRSFIAPCYNWDDRLEFTFREEGIDILQGLRNQLVPTGVFGKYEVTPHYFGERNNKGLLFNIRNCFLEPSLNPQKDWVDSCLAQVDIAFRMHKPAVICSHRINYVGFIETSNRDRGLRDLKQLLRAIQKRWPDVQFISTDQLPQLLK